jgi:hypothetical protein
MLARDWEDGRLLFHTLYMYSVASQDIPMVISQDFMRTGKAFGKSMQLLQELQVFSQTINFLLKNIDPTQFACLEEARTVADAKYPYVKAVNQLDPLLMEGRAIMWNRTTPKHKDIRDPKLAWAALVVLGWITSGWLLFPQLKLKVRYQPGDIVYLRGAVLDHKVSVWKGKQRICVAHFTHESYFRDLGLTCRTAPGVPPTDPPPTDHSFTSMKLQEEERKRKRKRKKGHS